VIDTRLHGSITAENTFEDITPLEQHYLWGRILLHQRMSILLYAAGGVALKIDWLDFIACQFAWRRSPPQRIFEARHNLGSRHRVDLRDISLKQSEIFVTPDNIWMSFEHFRQYGRSTASKMHHNGDLSTHYELSIFGTEMTVLAAMKVKTFMRSPPPWKYFQVCSHYGQ
jgi:hypothetical protein